MSEPGKDPLPPRPPADAQPPFSSGPSAGGPKFEEGPRFASGPKVVNKNAQSQGGGKKAAVGLFGVLGIALLKFKALGLIGFKLLTSFKLLVFFKSFLSMFIMLGVYTVLFGWVYAFIVIGLILIHELGHFIWMKATGLNPKSIIFMPFGAATFGDQADNQSLNAWVSMGGPLIGGLTSIALYYGGLALGKEVMMAAGWTGVWLNMFQLVPARPLDGGYIVGAISKWLLLPGTFILFFLAIVLHTPIMLIIALLAAWNVFKVFTGRDISQIKMRPASPLDKLAIGATYIGLILVLGFVYAQADAHLLRVIRNL